MDSISNSREFPISLEFKSVCVRVEKDPDSLDSFRENLHVPVILIIGDGRDVMHDTWSATRFTGCL